MKPLPPLNLLLTLESAHRLGSLRRAAEEMSLSPSAVSHRIRKLEEILGCALFVPSGQGIVSTDATKVIVQSVQQAMGIMQQALQQVEFNITGHKFRVLCMSAFASYFVLPELKQLKLQCPGIELELDSQPELSALENNDFDLLVRTGTEPVQGFWCEPLIRVAVLPIVSPSMRCGIFRDEMLYGPLLGFRNTAHAWSELAVAMGKRLHPEAESIMFNSMESIIAAVKNGMGVAALPTWEAERLLNFGVVATLLEQPFLSAYYYWIIARTGEQSEPSIKSCRKWLLSQVRGKQPDVSNFSKN